MFRNSRLNTVVVPLTALVAVLTLACHEAKAQVEPFKVTGGGIVDYVPLLVDTPVFHFAIGNATKLGQYYAEGKFQLLEFTSPTSADFSSTVPCVFTAANGDKLAFHYGRTDFGAAAPGNVVLVPAAGGKFIAVFTAEFNPVLGASTGRFAKVVDGSFIMIAITEPFVLGPNPVAYTWKGDGWLKFANP
jgi:hypothetical protein